MPILILEEPYARGKRAIVASSTDPNLIRSFWRTVLTEAEQVVENYRQEKNSVMAVLKRAELERLRLISGLFGGD